MPSNNIRALALGITIALSAAACGSSDDLVATATQATTTAAPAETTTTAQATTTAAPAEATTTAQAPTTTTTTTTTTEPPVAEEAKAVGEPLQTMNEAVGLASPTIVGNDYLSTDPVSWGADGPAAVLFAPLADWCPHCSVHLEQLTDYLADNDGPREAQVLLVTQEEQPSAQHPQDEWLTSKGWPYATILDTPDISISKAFGITSVPAWILVGSDGTVAEVIDAHDATPAEVVARIDALE